MNSMLNDMLSKHQDSLRIGIACLKSCVDNLDSDNDFASNFVLLKNVLAIANEELKLMENLYLLKKVEVEI